MIVTKTLVSMYDGDKVSVVHGTLGDWNIKLVIESAEGSSVILGGETTLRRLYEALHPHFATRITVPPER